MSARMRAGGRRARAQFQHLAEEHQYGDHGCGFEIDRHRAVVRRASTAGRSPGASVAAAL